MKDGVLRQKSRWSRILLVCAKLGVTVLLLLLLARRVPLGEAFAGLDAVPPWLWAFGIGINGLVLLLAAWRWHLTSLRTIPMQTCLVYTWIGQFFSLVLPGNVVGDIVKTASLAASDARQRTLVLPMSVMLDRLLGLIALLLMFAVAVAAMWWGTWRVTGLALVGGASLAAIFTPQVIGMVVGLAHGSKLAPGGFKSVLERVAGLVRRLHGRPWLSLFVLSLVMHAITALVFGVAARQMGVAAELWRLGVYYVGMNLVIMLPVTFAGVGAREQFSVWLLGAAAGVASMPVTLSWYLMLTNVAHAAIGAVVQLLKSLYASRQPLTSDDTP